MMIKTCHGRMMAIMTGCLGPYVTVLVIVRIIDKSQPMMMISIYVHVDDNHDDFDLLVDDNDDDDTAGSFREVFENPSHGTFP